MSLKSKNAMEEIMNKQKGFTLIETLVVALLSGIVGLGVVNVIATSNRILNTSTRQSFYDNQLNYVMNEISRDIKQGYRIALPSVPSNTIKITQRVGGVDRIVEWNLRKIDEQNDAGIYPVRKADGKERVYTIIGLNSKNYKEMKPSFTFPTGFVGTFKPGKYFGVNVIIDGEFYIGGESDWKNRIQSTVYCRAEEDGI
jgi:prepilin-type N-terminal cleavage/methylation domain-containing protein